MWCLSCGRSGIFFVLFFCDVPFDGFESAAYLEDEMFIVLIGASGSGKTLFIRQLAGDLSDPAAYRFNKRTTRITATTVDFQGVDITLLDTPGIGSLASGRELSGYDIFHLVRNWLQNKRCSAHLTGILYFQNVDDKWPM
ncbi:hypothetical protein EV401DRAFT_591814 [Pisolithus croceorrhizus]|nr:hypothetical protein EV401DRAFT_591814 [Pisolithus croceorrhizus]